jgi:small subunit ribosomal protein S18
MPVRKETKKSNSDDKAMMMAPRAKKPCFFCENKVKPIYTDTQTLKKFINDRSRIVASSRTGLCSKHQRSFTREVKHARHLSMLPFIARA